MGLIIDGKEQPDNQAVVEQVKKMMDDKMVTILGYSLLLSMQLYGVFSQLILGYDEYSREAREAYIDRLRLAVEMDPDFSMDKLLTGIEKDVLPLLHDMAKAEVDALAKIVADSLVAQPAAVIPGPEKPAEAQNEAEAVPPPDYTPPPAQDGSEPKKEGDSDVRTA